MLNPSRRPLPDGGTAEVDEFASEVLQGLSRPGKTLPCRFFYDARGSELFERITRLPEYYPTRGDSDPEGARRGDGGGRARRRRAGRVRLACTS